MRLIKIIQKNDKSLCLFKSKQPFFSLMSSCSQEIYYALDVRANDAKYLAQQGWAMQNRAMTFSAFFFQLHSLVISLISIPFFLSLVMLKFVLFYHLGHLQTLKTTRMCFKIFFGFIAGKLEQRVRSKQVTVAMVSISRHWLPVNIVSFYICACCTT